MPAHAPHAVAGGATRAAAPPRRGAAAPPRAAADPQAATPLLDAVARRARSAHEAPFHVPGHKRGAGAPRALATLLGGGGAPFAADLTELAGLDLLSAPDGPIAEAQALAARAWGAGRSFFLVNGSTAGIHAAVLAACTGGGNDALVLPRNAHLSAFNAAALAGAAPFWARPVSAAGMAHQLEPAALAAALAAAAAAGRRPAAALVVSPTYFGATSDVAALAAVAHAAGAALIVDAAHGAHLQFIRGLEEIDGCCGACVPALAAGADAVIQSTHKTLGALTPGAMLHLGVNSRIDGARVAAALAALQTSSPSYLVMASLDAARAQAAAGGAVAAAHAAAARCGEEIAAAAAAGGPARLSPALVQRLLMNSRGGDGGGDAGTTIPLPPPHDPWRATLLVDHLGWSGWAAAAALEERFGVVAELATHRAVVLAMGVGTAPAHAAALAAALSGLGRGPGVAPALLLCDDNDADASEEIEVVITPREASRAAAEAVPAAQAVGRVSAELLCTYPPGVPAVFPGERVTAAAVARLRAAAAAGGRVAGAADATLCTLRVVVDEA
jgi:arginine/lysine/ornithine decarboxylase